MWLAIIPPDPPGCGGSIASAQVLVGQRLQAVLYFCPGTVPDQLLMSYIMHSHATHFLVSLMMALAPQASHGMEGYEDLAAV